MNGAEVRRLLFMPAILRGGERLAGAVIGVRTEGMLARTGVVIREEIVGGVGSGLAKSSKASRLPLVFFESEVDWAGSTFSLSYSSNVETSKGRLLEENAVLVGLKLALPPKGDFWAVKPASCQYSYLWKCQDVSYTYHSGDSSRWRDAEDAGCPAGRMAPSPWGRVQSLEMQWGCTRRERGVWRCFGRLNATQARSPPVLVPSNVERIDVVVVL